MEMNEIEYKKVKEKSRKIRAKNTSIKGNFEQHQNHKTKIRKGLEGSHKLIQYPPSGAGINGTRLGGQGCGTGLVFRHWLDCMVAIRCRML